MSIESWDPMNKHVQGGLREYNYVSGRNTLICVGPPYLNSIVDSLGGEGGSAKNVLYPIGLAQNFAIAQNAAVQQIHEIGAEKAYFFRGRTVRQVNLGRIVYHGPSLLRVLYSWYTSGDIEAVNDPFDTTLPKYLQPFAVDGDTLEPGTGTEITGALPMVKVPPGYENVWLNLASDIFRMPTGLFVLIRDNEDNNVAAYYLEQCHVPTHTIAVDSQGLLMQETVSIICGGLIPINLSAVQLLKGFPSQNEFVADTVNAEPAL